MIAIVNVGPHDDPNPLGVRTYEVRINRDVVATFDHARGDGLAACLMEAAKAVERKKWDMALRFLEEVNGAGLQSGGAGGKVISDRANNHG